MKITENKEYKRIDLEFEKPEYKSNLQPFDNRFDYGKQTFIIKNGERYRATVRYEKRPGGTYIYSNNPEMLAPEDVGQAILVTKDLFGDVIFTYEHSNHTGVPVWLGYRLLNEGESDVTVTVTNIGIQVDGEWLGQRSWSDYFNYRFELPEDYFFADGSVNPIYVGCDYIDYTPRKADPQTFRIPAGKYIYVLGGTTSDAYGHTDVMGTADRAVLIGKCSNGVVKFNVSGGAVTGTFFCYSDIAQVQAEPKEQGFITERVRDGKKTDYSKQYKGFDPTAGLIESKITFVVDDETAPGDLPVRYAAYSDPDCMLKKEPYNAYDPVPCVIEDTAWYTSLDPNNSPGNVGNDMMVFNCVDPEGNKLIIDTFHADSSGDPANIGNWMVQYTDNFTLVNAGTKERTFTFFKRGNNGVLFTMAREENGDIICAKALTGPYSFGGENEIFAGVDRRLLLEKNGRLWFRLADGRPYCDAIEERSEVVKIKVAPKEVKRISIDSVILGNSCGGIKHRVNID